MVCSPPPANLRSVLKDMNRTATSSDTNINSVRKEVRFVDEPIIHDITPRPDKIPGVIKMPDSPPGNKAYSFYCLLI